VIRLEKIELLNWIKAWYRLWVDVKVKIIEIVYGFKLGLTD